MLDNAGGSHRLVIAADPDWLPADRDAFIAALTERGLFGSHWRDGRYRVGRRFMQEIVFVGCSPFLRVEPRDDLDFCHLQLSLAATPRFVRSAEAGVPRCPDCGQPLTSTAEPLYCDHCQRPLHPAQCRWRRGRTIWSRCWISVWTLQKGDAWPAEPLLAFLQRQSEGRPWKTAFL